MDSTNQTAWNQRYADSELVWSAAPNVWVEQLTKDLPPGKALDMPPGRAATPCGSPLADGMPPRWTSLR